MSTRSHLRASVVTTVAFLVFVGVMATKGQGRPVAEERPGSPVVSADDLAALAHTRLFFEHQSVGMNVLDGIPAVYAAEGRPGPDIVELPPGETAAAPAALTGRDSYVAHAFFGQNGDPVAKVADFEARIRGGLGGRVDVAFMKFCYVDITSDTDVDALFELYRDTIAGLERDYPAVTFLKVTTPVTTERSVASRVKALLGHDDHMGPADNLARQRLNSLMRREYAGPELFDLARMESTAPDGTRVTGTHDGERYFALYPGYAADAGHLDAEGSSLAAARLLQVVAHATRRS